MEYELSKEMPEFLKRSPRAASEVTEKPLEEKRTWVMPKKGEKTTTVSATVPELSTEAKNTLLTFGLASEIEDIVFNTLYGTDDLVSINRVIKLSAAKPKVVRVVMERVKALVAEIQMIGSEEDVTEAYSYLDQKQIAKLKSLSKDALFQIRAHLYGKKAAKTQDDKKSKRVEKATQNVKFQAEDHEFGLVSLDPSKVIGATQVITYDTKRQQLGVYIALPEKTLSFKGTTIQDFDSEKSYVKRLRKPSEVIAQIIGATEKRTLDVMENLTTKAQAISGRTRNEIMFLKVFN